MSFPKPGRCFSRHAEKQIVRIRRMKAQIRAQLQELEQRERLAGLARKMKQDVAANLNGKERQDSNQE